MSENSTGLHVAPIIFANGLCKDYRVLAHKPGTLGAFFNLFSGRGRTVRAVDHVGFSIYAGESVGFVGPNGAGKSTTIKMLTGILVPTTGEARVGNYVPWKARKENSRQIGVVFGQRTQLWWDLPPIEAYELLGKLYRVEGGRLRDNIESYTRMLDVVEQSRIPVRKLSLGQRMRCDIVAALLHDPPTLILDEPTIGLDVVAKQTLREFLKRMNRERRTTILLTTHDLDDIEEICARVIVIDHGKIIHDGSLASLKTKFGDLRTVVADIPGVAAVVPPQGSVLRKVEGHRYWIDFDADITKAPAVISDILARYNVTDLAVHPMDIEEVVRRIYGR